MTEVLYGAVGVVIVLAIVIGVGGQWLLKAVDWWDGASRAERIALPCIAVAVVAVVAAAG